jgi:hypothetical protein
VCFCCIAVLGGSLTARPLYAMNNDIQKIFLSNIYEPHFGEIVICAFINLVDRKLLSLTEELEIKIQDYNTIDQIDEYMIHPFHDGVAELNARAYFERIDRLIKPMYHKNSLFKILALESHLDGYITRKWFLLFNYKLTERGEEFIRNFILEDVVDNYKSILKRNLEVSDDKFVELYKELTNYAGSEKYMMNLQRLGSA